MERELRVKIEIELWKRFKIALIQRGETSKDVIERFIKEYLKEKKEG